MNNVLIVGAGNMGEAMLKGWLKANNMLKQVYVREPDPSNWLKKIHNEKKILLNPSNIIGKIDAIKPDGTIMDGASHEDSTGKILQVKELKYFIQEISPSRNEIRIVPQKIKDNKYSFIIYFISTPSWI